MVVLRLDLALFVFILLGTNLCDDNTYDLNSDFRIYHFEQPISIRRSVDESLSSSSSSYKPNNNFIIQSIDLFNKTINTNENQNEPSNFDIFIKFSILFVFLIICFTCIFGNILVILSVFTYRPLQSVQNIFIVSLALADTFVAIFVMPFHVTYFMSNGKWLFGKLVCHFFLTLDILLCTSSILHLCCIALDRYWAIKDSIKYAQKRTFKRVMIMILIAWLLSAVVSVPVIIWNMKTVGPPIDSTSTSDYIHNNVTNSTNDQIVCDIPHDKLYRFYSSSGTFFVPLLIMTFVYVRIYLETKRRLRERAKAAKKLVKSMANSSSTPIVNKTKSSIFNFKKLNKYKCLCCFEKSKSIVKINSNENIGAYLNEESVCCEGDLSKNHKQIVFVYDDNQCKETEENLLDKCESIKLTNKDQSVNSLNIADSDESNQSLKNGKKPSIIRKVSIGINTVAESQPNDDQKPKIKKLDFNIPQTERTQIVNNTTGWQRNPANSGTTLKQRQKISLTRERRAARTLGIIMGAFTVCWFPFFLVYLLQSFDYFTNGYGLFEFLTWLGYVNSALNPIIYTIFNIDFRKSFERILFKCILCKRR